MEGAGTAAAARQEAGSAAEIRQAAVDRRDPLSGPRRRSVLVRMTEDGRKLETVRIANSPAELRKVIARAGENPRVVVEATYGWYWAADALEEAGAEVHLAHPLGREGLLLPEGEERRKGRR
jgi:hypothetical protein